MPDNAPNTSRYLEVERKFDVGESTSSPSFAGMADILRVERLPTQTLDAVYFDTPARDLASRRITLRRRTGGVDAGWHLKLPAGTDARTEVRAPLGTADGGDEESQEDVPTELVDVVLAIVRDRPLCPVARITTTRGVHHLYGADDAVLAEFCDDQVTASRAATADAPEVEQRWREWELELAQPDTNTALLDKLSDRLLGAGATRAGHGSKLARVLGTTPKDLSSSDPLHRAVAEQLDELLVWDRAVRAEADDAVHQMRVTTRKIRSLLQASPDSFALSDGLLDELGELASVLGEARDAEVLAERYSSAIDGLPPELVRGPVRERLIDGAEYRYRTGLRHALAALRSPRYFRLLDALEAVIATASPTDQEAAPVTVAAAAQKVRKAAKAARRVDDEDRDDAIHRIRKRAKRLRYTAAATGEPKVSKRAKKIQSLLGDHQDSVVSRAHLLQQAEAAHAAGEETFTYGLLYQQETDLALERRQHLQPRLRKLFKSVRRLSR
ncbi:MAG: CYTH and CHAD domain-containing protein [Mycobacterium sp.]|uniref:CYTH and CHAD domain-containing protein n=1 Tax=Mycobacterium sp. TaxID=1785 RepID=UPI003BAF9EAE